MKTPRFLFAACIFLALMFTHSCSGAAIKKNYSGTFTDDRDGKSYKTIGIGSQIWMAENLNYETEGSVCYENSDSNCDTYGRLYNWETAMKSCPSGWHLPSDEEWQILVDFAGGDKVAGTKLKAKSYDWEENLDDRWRGVITVVTDEYGFSALPGGYGDLAGNFSNVGYYGVWWNSSEDNSNNYVYSQVMLYNESNVYGSNGYKSESGLFSVRCVQD